MICYICGRVVHGHGMYHRIKMHGYTPRNKTRKIERKNWEAEILQAADIIPATISVINELPEYTPRPHHWSVWDVWFVILKYYRRYFR